MAKPVTGSIPNLVNGVSQQAPALRLPTQGQSQENFYSTIVEGLKDRPPSEFVAKLLSTLPDGVFTHIINRDQIERYIVVSDGTSVRVWGFDGAERTVHAPGGYGYLAGVVTPATDMAALTVADYTFMVNKKKVAAMATTPVEPVRGAEALYNVLAGNYGKTYNILINGGTAGTYTAPDGSSATQSPQVDTTYIAAALVTSLTANGFSAYPWTCARYGNAVLVTRTDGGDFTTTVEDGYNGNAMKAAKSRVQKFSDLPSFGPNGINLEITGEPNNDFDNYWVKLDTSAAGIGVWRESVKPGTKLDIDNSTLPFTLIRNSDGSFNFQAATWDPRKCGDDQNISPDPSFIGTTISDVFFHRNRLGFLSDQNSILSRNGSFFDFFRTSATAVLDDDPIDVGASHTKVSILKHAVPFQKDLLLFSGETQFSLSANDMLTPKTVGVRPLTEYVNDELVRPLTLGTSVFFATKRGDWESMWEYAIDNQSGTPIANEVTSHVPSYIPAGAYKIAGTSNESVVCVLTTGDPTAFYVYKYYWSANQKLQAAWQRWTLAGSPTILNAEFIDSFLYVVVKRSDGVYLEKLRMQPNAFDTGLGFLVHLDQRVHTDQLSAPSYNSTTKLTTYTLPYTPSAATLAVTAPGGSSLAAIQVAVASINAGTNTVTLTGDTRTYKMWFGTPYERRYRFSRFFLKQQLPGGGTRTVQNGRLQLRAMSLAYDKAAYFRVEVTLEGHAAPYVYTVTGRKLGDATNVLGTVPLLSGKKTIPLMARNDRVTVDIVNDSWMPSSFISVEWAGTHTEKAREL